MKDNYKIINDTAIIKINENIYSKETIIQACYVKIEEFYILIDKENEYFIVNLKYKEENKNNNLKKAVFDFFDELIESKSYLDQLKRTSKIRETILERALLTQRADNEISEKEKNNLKSKHKKNVS